MNNLSKPNNGLKQYIVGFILSLIFSVVPFLGVISGYFSVIAAIIIILICATIQFFIQMVFFMHITEGGNAKWNVFSVLFTSIITLVIVVGSVWIMYSLDHFAGYHSTKVDIHPKH